MSSDASGNNQHDWPPLRHAKAGLRLVFDQLERGAERLFSPAFNPLAQLGAISFFLFWVVAVSGIYLFIFFDTGVVNAYSSVEWISDAHWYHAGVMRSFHRYASDLMVLSIALHLLREFSLDRYRGTRWFSWFTGIPLIWFLYISGITGYWLVWDKLAQYVAIVSAELLDVVPIFGEPLARNFLTPEHLSSRFFSLLVFLHIAVPLVLLLGMWIHIQRISRPKVNPPRLLAALVLAALLAVALLTPAVSQGPADLTKVPAEISLDWFYLPLLPLAEKWGGWSLWGLLVGVSTMLAAMPWLPPFRRAPAATVDLPNCNGCNRCVEDCPYEAIRLVPRTDGEPFPHQAEVSTDLCVSCGICMGSCPSSTPFRRTVELKTGIDLPGQPLREVRDSVAAASSELRGDGRVMVLACEHGAGSGAIGAVVTFPCVAMIPPSLIDFILSRNLADGVIVAGCGESVCYNRLGVEWTKQRFAGARDPYLRKRVPRERLATIWASPFETNRFEAEKAAFAERLQGLASALQPVARRSANEELEDQA
ncbi:MULTISPECIES: cytochrome b N-terminal domain-containing protein [Chelativorans]|jgi:ferredoxin/coenzyme F420-reducing hydrogenase delta subunit|uniref:Cytochrome b/b6-like protein n=1 Tax=Chelativorans sp. (strain BNC1) TaxID=266779 RepID=Q11MU7_CHESB|nr:MULTISPECIES: cytochrome b N-terminal domain-containing protein [Chelativorans]